MSRSIEIFLCLVVAASCWGRAAAQTPPQARWTFARSAAAQSCPDGDELQVLVAQQLAIDIQLGALELNLRDQRVVGHGLPVYRVTGDPRPARRATRSVISSTPKGFSTT